MKSEKGQGVLEFVMIGILLIVVGLLLLAFMPRSVANDIQNVIWAIKTGNFGALELTGHAEVSHATQAWNATTIAEFMDAGNCSPNSCTLADREMFFCQNPDKENEMLLLIVSLTTGKVITGYSARSTQIDKYCGATP